jgi:hypothetical protein
MKPPRPDLSNVRVIRFARLVVSLPFTFAAAAYRWAKHALAGRESPKTLREKDQARQSKVRRELRGLPPEHPTPAKVGRGQTATHDARPCGTSARYRADRVLGVRESQRLRRSDFPYPQPVAIGRPQLIVMPSPRPRWVPRLSPRAARPRGRSLTRSGRFAAPAGGRPLPLMTYLLHLDLEGT